MNLPAAKSRFVDMRIVHHWVSLTATFAMVFSFLYLLQEYTMGFLPILRNWMVGPVTGRSIVFSVIALLLILRYVKIRSPYNR